VKPESAYGARKARWIRRSTSERHDWRCRASVAGTPSRPRPRKMPYKSTMALATPSRSCGALHIPQCESVKPVFMSHQPGSCPPTLALHLTVRSAHLNIPNQVKLWHKSAPLLITAVMFLGLVFILHHYAPLGAGPLCGAARAAALISWASRRISSKNASSNPRLMAAPGVLTVGATSHAHVSIKAAAALIPE